MENPIDMDTLIQLQKDVRFAFNQVVEVETRDSGWKDEDARAADKKYEEACAAYKNSTGLDPEYEDRVDMIMRTRFPMAHPSGARLKKLTIAVEGEN